MDKERENTNSLPGSFTSVLPVGSLVGSWSEASEASHKAVEMV